MENNKRQIEKEKLFNEISKNFKFTENDLCVYSMYNNHEDELHNELIQELINEKKIFKFHYDAREDVFYPFGKYANPEYIVAYQKNIYFGEEEMTDEEFVDSLLNEIHQEEKEAHDYEVSKKLKTIAHSLVELEDLDNNNTIISCIITINEKEFSFDGKKFQEIVKQ